MICRGFLDLARVRINVGQKELIRVKERVFGTLNRYDSIREISTIQEISLLLQVNHAVITIKPSPSYYFDAKIILSYIL